MEGSGLVQKIAFITGGGSGIGLACAQALAADGWAVMVCDLSEQAAHAVAAELPGKGHRAFVMDVADEAAVVSVFATVEQEVGPVRLLLTSAGMMAFPSDGSRPTIVATSLEDWERTYAVNTRGTFLCIREYLRHRNERPVEQGRVITISSAAAQIGGYNGSCAYISSKGAVLSLTKSAAREAAPDITVNVIAPGTVETPLLRRAMPPERDAAYLERVPLNRLAQPEELAATVMFLASEGAAYITGACIDVNGGFRMQ